MHKIFLMFSWGLILFLSLGYIRSSEASSIPVVTETGSGQVVAGHPTFTMGISGTNLGATGAVVLWNGSARATKIVNMGLVDVTILASDVSNPAGGIARISVKNSAGTSSSVTYTILPALSIQNKNISNGVKGISYSATVFALGGVPPYYFSVSQGSLPKGFTLNSSTGVISGMPSAPESASFTVKVTDSGALQHIATNAYSMSIVTGIPVAPTDDLQTLVNQYPAGTAFILGQGAHHDTVTSIKSGDIFTSPSGTTSDGVIENGSKALTNWKEVTISGKNYWTTAGGTPLGYTFNSTQCEAAFQACYYSQDLYLNNVDYTHAVSLSGVAAGTWFYDFSGSAGSVNNIYLSASDGINPNNQTVELAALEFAFESATATNVTVQGLIVEKYAPMLQEGAIETLAADWLIQNNEVLLNHGEGIQAKPGNENTRILNNYAHDNGDLGIGGGSINGGTISHNTIYHNNIDHVLSGWGAGGFKTGGSVNLLVSYNLVYDNLGNGLHADVFSNGVTFDHNTVYGNLGEGIRCEISDNCTITNNIVYGNEPNPYEPGTNVQIQIAYASSSHGIIQNNIVATSASTSGIVISYSTARPGCGTGCTIPVGMNVSKNTIYLTSVVEGSALEDTSSPSTASSWEVSGIYDSNTYCASSAPWNSSSWTFSTDSVVYNNLTFANWQKDGHQDALGKLSTTCSPAP